MVQGARAGPLKPHERRPALVHGSPEATPGPVNLPLPSFRLRRGALATCWMLSPWGEAKRGFFLPYPFARFQPVICDLDLSELESADPPRGFGRVGRAITVASGTWIRGAIHIWADYVAIDGCPIIRMVRASRA